ncbi:class I SAM-dependent methyltransferase [Maridesulfovibrio salexigens]|uniref:Methyltransferase type 11 n=1 Tax=Maridesulfovibrio salexigens (strain ATCC 14822 / DSM 2638 / NCIMB 8403 / VKM B-1763) TaxID=526222 RepID=C6BXR6_MARSD|nr:class I SAM-dependent methyltransferase [Maridesulfovibrio salexigens]ACS78624.1 Methyltransferase type 11 [Maridesulfovibrio salexigens DSM 2638]
MIRLSPHMAHNLKKDPKRLAFVLARYSFAAQMTADCGSILELGCSEGIGAAMLHGGTKQYLGMDLDTPAIEAARNNFASDKVCFKNENFLNMDEGKFEAVVSLDVVEHISKGADEDAFFKTIHDNITENGVCVIGTPNITSTPYASPESMRGHVNMFDAMRLKSTLENYFKNVFIFSMNDEMVHTGFHSMAHYLFAVGCNKIT